MSEVRETVNAGAEPTRAIGITGTDYADFMPANTADDLIAPREPEPQAPANRRLDELILIARVWLRESARVDMDYG